MAMKKQTQRIIAALLVFLMIATLMAGIFAGGGDTSQSPAGPFGVTEQF